MSAGLLFDTHTLIWSRLEPGKLKTSEQQAIDEAEQLFVSRASLWELAVLMRAGRYVIDHALFELPEGCEWLEILPSHCQALIDLPLHHRDPFDRMLIAQAKAERFGLLTRDHAMLRYGRLRDGLLIPD